MALTMPAYRLTEPERAAYRRYAALALPRHTSYPSTPAWRAYYGPADFRDSLRRSVQEKRPLSLYVYIPFCERLCYYCACTKEIVPPNKRVNGDPGDPFLQALEIEAGRFADVIGRTPRPTRSISAAARRRFSGTPSCGGSGAS